MDLRRLPGGELIAAGLDDLAHGRVTGAALLVQVGAPRLTRLGLNVPAAPPRVEHRLYALLASTDPRHRAFALQRPDSPDGQLRAGRGMRALTEIDRLRRFMRALGDAAEADARVYFTGGATAVLLGWREATIP